MQTLGAIVRTGDPVDHKTPEQVAGVLRLHIDEGCWTSSQRHDVRPGTPVIASHIAAGLGQFLVGVFTGEFMDVPWQTAPEHANHVGHRVVWMDAVFIGDADAIEGAKGRGFQWLSTAEFNDAWSRLRVREDGV